MGMMPFYLTEIRKGLNPLACVICEDDMPPRAADARCLSLILEERKCASGSKINGHRLLFPLDSDVKGDE